MGAHGKSPALFILTLLAGIGNTQCSDAPETAKPGHPGLLERVGVMGASASAGFANQGIKLADYLEVAILSPHETIDVSTYLFGLSPDACAFNAFSRLGQEKTTVVFGVDYFFWFSHGFFTFEGRRALLQRGCALAEELDCPFVAGDIPDLWESEVAKLAPDLLPKPGEIETLNGMLHAWADGQDHVLLLPLAGMVESMKSGNPIVVNGRPRRYALGEILHWDGIHPTIQGSAVLALVALESLADKYALDKSRLLLDVDALFKALKQEARKRKMEEKRLQ
jgi:hypothetical protein